MKYLDQIRCLAITLACFGFIVPQSLLAAERTTNLPNRDVVNSPAAMPAPTVYDVVLGQNGALYGKVVDRQGAPLADTPVGLFQNGRQVAVSKTDANGQFSFVGIRGGTYVVKAGYGVAVYRLWAPETAPPVARDVAMVVSGSQVVRGQIGPAILGDGGGLLGLGLGGSLLLGGGIIAAIVIPLATNNGGPAS